MSFINRREETRNFVIICAVILYVPVLYLTLKCAEYITPEGGPALLIAGLTQELERPFHFHITEKTIKAVAVVTVLFVMLTFVICGELRNYRYDEEFGSARWANNSMLNKRYRTLKPVFDDIEKWRQDALMTENIRMGFDFEEPTHQRNLNTMIIGGSGTWKSRGYILPNLCQMNCSFVVTDPKGELARKTGWMLKQHGYDVKVFDVANPDKSLGYNPFKYFRDDKDVLLFVNNFFAACDAKAKGSQKMDPFWDDQAKNLMLALAYYLFHEAKEDERSLPMILDMLHAAEIDEEGNPSAIDIMFQRLEIEKPGHIAVGFYKDYHKGGAKTLQSIQSTLSAKLALFNIGSLSSMTAFDEIDILSIGERKTALFLVIPDSDKSLNFIVGTLYQQMFQQLYDLADNKYHGKLPVHVRFLMDEFANVALPDDYNTILSTARSRNMSFVIVLQDKSQIENLFDKLYKNIMANCDEWLFLGSNELETCKLFSELCGKETIYIKSYSRSYGRMANYTVNRQKQQRDLITPDEMRRKANRIAILIIRGEFPALDNKIDLKRHRNYRYIAEGKNLTRKKEPAKLFLWGEPELAYGGCQITWDFDNRTVIDADEIEASGKVLAEEELFNKCA